MSRELYVAVEVVDQLPVYEPDGVTKRSGLGAGAFSSTVWRNGVEVALAVTVAEIGGSGEYAVRFTPNLTGFYVVEVVNSYNGEGWIGEYDVVRPVLLGVV